MHPLSALRSCPTVRLAGGGPQGKSQSQQRKPRHVTTMARVVPFPHLWAVSLWLMEDRALPVVFAVSVDGGTSCSALAGNA